jgi:hypothetical protein
MRMHIRRFTRLTNAFSKRIENHIAAIALHFMYYNFVRIHQTLRCTLAMAAGVSNKLWDIHGIVELVEAYRAEQAAEKKEAARKRIEQSYSQIGDALGGKRLKF